MSKEKEKPKYKDFIEEKSEMVKFLDAEQTKLAAKFGPIIAALRENKHMTAKEIHDLYIDEETKKHTYTIKTIYRYLEKLEELDLVKNSGHRMIKGQRLPEKLYSRTADIFFKAEKKEIHPDIIEHQKKNLQGVFTVLEQVEGKPDIDYKIFEEVMLKRMELQQKYNREVTTKIPKNKILTDFYSTLHIDTVNYISDMVSELLIFAKHPELFEKLMKLYKN